MNRWLWDIQLSGFCDFMHGGISLVWLEHITTLTQIRIIILNFMAYKKII